MSTANDQRNVAPAIVPDSAVGIPKAAVSFRATLTATTNPYLAPRLPLDGFVKIHERSVHGECQFVTFMPDPEVGPDGVLANTSFVSVPDATFTFSTRV